MNKKKPVKNKSVGLLKNKKFLGLVGLGLALFVTAGFATLAAPSSASAWKALPAHTFTGSYTKKTCSQVGKQEGTAITGWLSDGTGGQVQYRKDPAKLIGTTCTQVSYERARKAKIAKLKRPVIRAFRQKSKVTSSSVNISYSVKNCPKEQFVSGQASIIRNMKTPSVTSLTSTGTNVEIGGLNPNTKYKATLKITCSGGTSSFPYPFKTKK